MAKDPKDTHHELPEGHDETQRIVTTRYRHMVEAASGEAEVYRQRASESLDIFQQQAELYAPYFEFLQIEEKEVARGLAQRYLELRRSVKL